MKVKSERMLKEFLRTVVGNKRPLLRSEFEYKVDDVLFNQGRIQSRMLRRNTVDDLSDAEFSVYSQWGEDGIIEYILQSIKDGAIEKSFVEFGIQGYRSPNTKFLLKNRNWRGLVMDGSSESIDRVKNDPLYWKYDLQARKQFVTRENINRTLEAAGFVGDVGLLSIDIDGNDYWIWEATDIISPAIVVIEYNSVFGNEHPVTVPYDDDFVRSEAHYSNLFFGASLPALAELASQKGYVLLGCNSSGNNAFFIDEEVRTELNATSAREGWVESKFRESRDREGNLNHLRGKERVDEIEEMEVYHLERESTTKLKSLRPLY